MLEEKLKAANNRQTVNQDLFCRKKSQHTVRHSRGHSQQFVAGGSWQVADKLLAQPRGELAYRTLVNRWQMVPRGAEEADGDGFVVAGSQVVANSQLAVFGCLCCSYSQIAAMAISFSLLLLVLLRHATPSAALDDEQLWYMRQQAKALKMIPHCWPCEVASWHATIILHAPPIWKSSACAVPLCHSPFLFLSLPLPMRTSSTSLRVQVESSWVSVN